ncbi:MAG: hypothetical protein QX198_05115 [Methylococcaceae bacterium]
MTHTLLSVLIASALDSRLLEESLKNLTCHQDYNIEVLVAIRGENSNESEDLIRGVCKKFPKVKCFNLPYLSLGATLNYLFNKARGTLCVTLHQGVTVPNEFFDTCIPLFYSQPELLVIRAEVDNRAYFAYRENHLNGEYEVDLSQYINSSSPRDYVAVWKRVAHILIGGFDDRLHTAADIDFLERLINSFPLRVKLLDKPILGASGVTAPNQLERKPSAQSLLSQTYSPPKIYKNTFFFCLTHKQPLYKLPEFVNVINVSPEKTFGDYHSPDFLPDFMLWEELLLGELGIFVAEDLLTSLQVRNPESYYVAFCYYRKFFSLSELGQPLYNGDPIYTVIQDTIDYQVIADEIANRLVAPMPTEFKHQTVLGAYSQSHFAGDFLFATRLAIKLGIIQRNEENEFLFGTQFCHWAHAGCTLPLPLFFFLVKDLRALFYAITASGYRSPIRNRPYQRRWIAFFFERLSSYLLLKHYPSSQVPTGKLHNVNLASEGLGVFNPGGLYTASS